MKKFILDTSVFVNPKARESFGGSVDNAVENFIKLMKKTKGMEFYMPPSVFFELSHFSTKTEELSLYVKKRAPNIYATYLPAAVFYAFIDDVRKRVNKGLRIAEQFAIDNRPNNEQKLRALREKYREAMRAGIVDSKEDFELILLAKEIDGTIVTSDEGVIALANALGCEWLEGEKFEKIMKKKKY
ncbi:MAG: RNA ligase partner protein [Candidatus Anstonellales archaeon]